MKYQITKLDSGLRVITHPMMQRHSVSVGLMVGAGGRYEHLKIKGAAHYLEHMLFKGSKMYSCDQIKQEIEGIGGFLNAFTSEEQTCYYAKVPANYLNKTFDVLSDMVFLPKLNAKDFDKEKGVILEEIKMYHDLPQAYVSDLLEEVMWGKDHPLGQSLAGSMESVSQMTVRDLKEFHQQRYFPNNIVVSVCGVLDHDNVVQMVKNKLGGFKTKGQDHFQKILEDQMQPHFISGIRKIEQIHLILAMPAYHEEHEDRYKLSVLATILGGNMSSRLFNEVREKRGLAYSISANVKYMHDIGALAIRVGVDANKVVPALKVIIAELEKIKNHKVSKDEFTRAKDYLLGQMALHLEDTMEHMLWMAESVLIRNYVKKLEEIIAEFDSITINDIQRVAVEILNEKKFNVAVVGPLKSTQKKEIENLIGINVNKS